MLKGSMIAARATRLGIPVKVADITARVKSIIGLVRAVTAKSALPGMKAMSPVSAGRGNT